MAGISLVRLINNITLKNKIQRTLVNWFGQYIKQFSYLLIFRIITIICNLIAGIIIARTIGEANRGIYGLFLTSLLVFNTILNLGFNTSVFYFAKKAEQKLKSIISFYFLFTLICMVIIYILLIAFSHVFKFQHISFNFIFILAYFFLSIGNIFRNIIIGKENTVAIYRMDAVIKFIILVIIICLMYLHLLTLETAIILLLIENIALYFYSLIKVQIPIFPLELDFQFLKKTINFNLKNYLVAILMILLLRSDQYFIKLILGNYYVGLYSVNASIIENLGIIGTLFSIQMLPKLIAEENFLRKLEKSKKHILLLFGSSLFIAIIFYFIAPFIIQLYFKTQIIEAVVSFRVLLIGFVFWTILNYIHVFYLSLRVKKTYLTILWSALFLNIILNQILIPKYGIIGSAWASSISYGTILLMAFIDLFILKKQNALKKLVL